MTSLYGEYIKERDGHEILELQDGFITYEISNEVCYIVEIYIRPHLRRAKIGSTLADTVVGIAKKRGCTILYGSVSLETKDPTSSTKALLGYGFKIHNYSQNLLWFTKEIEKE